MLHHQQYLGRVKGGLIRMVIKYKPRFAVKAAISSVGIGRVATFTARIPSCYSSSTRQDTGTDIAFTASWSLILHIQQSEVTDM